MTDVSKVALQDDLEDRYRTGAPPRHCSQHQEPTSGCDACLKFNRAYLRWVITWAQAALGEDVEGAAKDRTVHRSVRLSTLAAELDDVPVWAWTYGGKGRIAVGTLALFAGRPGAGKSTAGRWMAAQSSKGALEGHWHGTPVNVAYIAAEESAKYVVKPGLRAAGADLNRIFMPKVEMDGEEVRFLSSHDMEELTRELIGFDVKLVIVDPLMSTIGSRTDINRNNEVRSLIEPWAKLAENIDGVVLGIAHLNKSGNGDVVAGINGSSAFGEVARAVFGFAKDPESEEGDRIMSQEKNSIGEEDLALMYRIESTTVTTDSGRCAEVGRFVIVGDSDRTVGDVLRTQPRAETGSAAHTEIDTWLLTLLENGPVLAKEVYSSADGAGYSTDKAKRAKERINKDRGAEVVEAFRPKVPGPWWWRRNDITKGAREQREDPHTLGSAPLRSSAPFEVREGTEGTDNPQGSKGAREQERTREDSQPIVRTPGRRPGQWLGSGEPVTNVTPLDDARRNGHKHEPRRRRRTRGGVPTDRGAS